MREIAVESALIPYSLTGRLILPLRFFSIQSKCPVYVTSLKKDSHQFLGSWLEFHHRPNVYLTLITSNLKIAHKFQKFSWNFFWILSLD